MNFNFKITEELKNKLMLMSKIYSMNKKNDAYPTSIKFDTNGMIHAINSVALLSYKLGSEELGMLGETPSSSFQLSDGAVRLLMATPIGTDIQISIENNIIKIKPSIKKKAAATFTSVGKEFPHINEIKKEDISISVIDREYLEQSIKCCAFAMSKSNDKPIYTGLHFVAKDGYAQTVSCDGFKLACVKSVATGNFSISLPKDTVYILQYCIKNAASKITVGEVVGGRKAVFILDSNTVLRTSLLSGEFFETDAFFENKGKKSFEIDSNDLLDVLDKVSVIADSSIPTSMVVVEMHSDECVISYHGNRSTYNDVVPIKSDGIGDTVERVGFNISFLTECLKSVNDSRVVINYETPLKPFVINGVTKNKPSTVIVPMRIGESK